MLTQEIIKVLAIIFILVVVYINYKQAKKIVQLEKEANIYKASKAFKLYVERQRQLKEENYTFSNDLIYNNLGELIGASAGYLETYLNDLPTHEGSNKFKFTRAGMDVYPWKVDKRYHTLQERKLIIAGALILAELDRINE